MTESKILGKSLGIVGRAQELIRLPHALPFGLREADISAAADVIVQRNDVKRRGIRRSVAVRVVREPGNEPGALRDLVRTLVISILILPQEVDPRTGCFEV